MNAAAQELQLPLQVDFCGLTLTSPIVLLSGCVGFGEE
jgi:dihydroorotate dehydrogenase (NAD+) catalytic subunit